MEAFRIQFKIYQKNGKSRKTTWKAFAATGWEAAEKAENELRSRHQIKGEFQLTNWIVLDPGQAHFS